MEGRTGAPVAAAARRHARPGLLAGPVPRQGEDVGHDEGPASRAWGAGTPRVVCDVLVCVCFLGQALDPKSVFPGTASWLRARLEKTLKIATKKR